MMTRQALHGMMCIFNHPITGEKMKMIAPLPEDTISFGIIKEIKVLIFTVRALYKINICYHIMSPINVNHII